MICEKCGLNVFFVNEINNCCDCRYNNTLNEEENGHTEIFKRLGLKCTFGNSYGNGCYMVICTTCKHKFNIPLMDN